jgi:Zn-dependent alcohol dehydrogenase
MEMTDGGVDYSFECTGITDVLREAFVSTHDVSGENTRHIYRSLKNHTNSYEKICVVSLKLNLYSE